MKKMITIFLAASMILTLASCGDKKDSDSKKSKSEKSLAESQTDEPTETDESSEDSKKLEVDGDPAEYEQSYWEEKYPDYMFCPFTIEENGEEKTYYWPMGYEGLDGTFSAWIECPFNWNGWHKAADGCIVNNDETLKITDDWADGGSMSSWCTITTEKYVGVGGSNENSGEAVDVKNNVPDELSFKTQRDIICQKNFLFSALYVGNDEDKSVDKDGLFFDFYDNETLYYVRTGFNKDDGTINFIWGYSRLYHFFDDEETYKAALAEVPDYLLKEQNDECYYFTTSCLQDSNPESYGDLIESFANQETDGGIFNNFMPYIE